MAPKFIAELMDLTLGEEMIIARMSCFMSFYKNQKSGLSGYSSSAVNSTMTSDFSDLE